MCVPSTMIPSLVPGNFAIMFRIGILPAGVSATKVSSSTCSLFSLLCRYCPIRSWPLLPSQRGPIATISFRYCQARAGSTCVAGPLGSAVYDGVFCAGDCVVCASLEVDAFLLLLQASAIAPKRRSAKDRHICRRNERTPACIDFLSSPLNAKSAAYSLPPDSRFSALFRRCFG